MIDMMTTPRAERTVRDTRDDKVRRRVCHRHRWLLLLPVVFTAMCAWHPSLAVGAPHVGYVYKLEGHLHGQPVKYIGSAASIKERLVKKHEWSDLLRQKTTKISYKKVYADLDVAAATRKKPYHARREALRSMEQLELDKAKKQVKAANRKRLPRRKRTRLLNSINVSSEPYVLQKRHSVTISRRWRVFHKPGASLILRSVGGVLFVAEAVRMYYDFKRSRFVQAPYLLEDEHGVFALDYSKSSWLATTRYFKTYLAGAKKGQKIRVSKSEFTALADEAKALWGTLDSDGDFVPGLLRPSLEVIVDRA